MDRDEVYSYLMRDIKAKANSNHAWATAVDMFNFWESVSEWDQAYYWHETEDFHRPKDVDRACRQMMGSLRYD